ncbi:Uncharacterised protein [Mycobacteroides abscessus subsp. abscessus]|nr:Uncharacterised protein [Mycobacteroides abscessus subsp. abscessus]
MTSCAPITIAASNSREPGVSVAINSTAGRRGSSSSRQRRAAATSSSTAAAPTHAFRPEGSAAYTTLMPAAAAMRSISSRSPASAINARAPFVVMGPP